MSKYQSYEFTIFDRWGEEIFRTNKISKGLEWRKCDIRKIYSG